MSAGVKKALAAKQRAADELAIAIARDYPPGHSIRWEWNAREYVGQVIRIGYGARLEVRNADTNRARWIHAYNIVSR